MATNATKWVVDRTTTLVKSDNGISIIWAGTEFGPATLEELCEGDLLDQCKALLETPGTPVERVGCDVGPLGDGRTILLPTETD